MGRTNLHLPSQFKASTPRGVDHPRKCRVSRHSSDHPATPAHLPHKRARLPRDRAKGPGCNVLRVLLAAIPGAKPLQSPHLLVYSPAIVFVGGKAEAAAVTSCAGVMLAATVTRSRIHSL